MKFNDAMNKDAIRQAMQEALQNDNKEAFANAMNDMMMCIGEEMKAEYEAQLAEVKMENDKTILSTRGKRLLTSEEKQYYTKLTDAMKAKDPKQALVDADLVLPVTVLDAVFDELQTSHPLLSRIGFVSSGGAFKMLMNTNGYQEAAWGALCDEIVKELLAGFTEVDATLLKLSAFIPVCKSALELGPEWLDDYVRQVLYEALANGLEAGIVNGDGNNKPIGMIRQVGEGVSVVGGVYPAKAKISVRDFKPNTIGNLLSLIAVDGNGKPRNLRDVILVVNPQDYFQKVMPATTIMAPDGTYRSDVMPYPITIIPSAAVESGEAVLGIGYKYFAAAGMERQGRIEYSDHYQFLEDNRVYLIKLFANGFPMDNNAFLYLDISELQPAYLSVETITPATPSAVATLASLTMGAAVLSPAFAAATTTYTATTSNASNTIVATPSDAGAEVQITVNGNEIDNGAAATWNTGENTVEITVTSADGSTEEVYTVTVTKS